jgi:hypothetical protein
MDANPADPRLSFDWDRHLNMAAALPSDAPELSGTLVTEQRITTASEHRGHPVPELTDLGGANAENTAMKAVQAAGSGPV